MTNPLSQKMIDGLCAIPEALWGIIQAIRKVDKREETGEQRRALEATWRKDRDG